MANDPTQVRVFGDGHVYTAPVGTAEPASIGASPSGSWLELGYLAEAGPQFSFGRTTKDINVWQSLFPVRTIPTGIPTTVKLPFMQLNRVTLPLALGGGTVTEGSPGEYTFTAAAASEVDERALMIEGIDGLYTYRVIFRRNALSDATGFSFVKDDATSPEATFKILDAGSGTAPFIIQTNDPSFEA